MHFKKSNDNQSTILHEGSVPYLTFKKLDQAGVRHGFSTRMGGVSEEESQKRLDSIIQSWYFQIRFMRRESIR